MADPTQNSLIDLHSDFPTPPFLPTTESSSFVKIYSAGSSKEVEEVVFARKNLIANGLAES